MISAIVAELRRLSEAAWARGEAALAYDLNALAYLLGVLGGRR